MEIEVTLIYINIRIEKVNLEYSTCGLAPEGIMIQGHPNWGHASFEGWAEPSLRKQLRVKKYEGPKVYQE